MLLASTQTSRDLFEAVAPWLLVFLAIVILGAIGLYAAKRMVKSGSGSVSGGFALEDLRRLHREGHLTDEEFRRAKEALIGRVKADAASPTADNDALVQNESD